MMSTSLVEPSSRRTAAFAASRMNASDAAHATSRTFSARYFHVVVPSPWRAASVPTSSGVMR